MTAKFTAASPTIIITWEIEIRLADMALVSLRTARILSARLSGPVTAPAGLA